jgi:hypothetical protein
MSFSFGNVIHQNRHCFNVGVKKSIFLRKMLDLRFQPIEPID